MAGGARSSAETSKSLRFLKINLLSDVHHGRSNRVVLGCTGAAQGPEASQDPASRVHGASCGAHFTHVPFLEDLNGYQYQLRTQTHATLRLVA